MWGWDPSQGEGPVGGTTPTLVPIESASPATTSQPQPVLIPNVQGLKQQFQQQQSELAIIKETLRENDADMSSKEKQLQMYANKLLQIKNRSKNAQKKPGAAPTSSSSTNSSLQRRSSKENLVQEKKLPRVEESSETDSKSAVKGKMNELKKRLEENKIKFEESTERGVSEKKMIETMVEQLRNQLQERDVTIHELQKTMDTPPARPKPQVIVRPKRKEKPLIISKWTQTQNVEKNDVHPRIKELEAAVVDLQDTVKQQASVIAARTQAVTLLSEDLSKKGKITVDDLEDTKKEMREMQNNFVQVESELNATIIEKDNRLADLEAKLETLEKLNAQLCANSQSVEMKLSEALSEKEALQNNLEDLKTTGFVSVSGCSLQVSELEMKVAQLTKELEDSNKLMIRLKLEHKNKLKAANKALDNVKQSSDDKAEILRLTNRVEDLETTKGKLETKIAELEDEKGNQLLSLLDYDEIKGSVSDMKKLHEDLNNIISGKNVEIDSLNEKLTSLQEENQKLLQTIDDQNIMIDNLNVRIRNVELDAENMEPFEIPGDAASRQFDLSNEGFQDQIENLVKEKQELLDKLKNLSGVVSTDSLTFEKIEPVESILLQQEPPVIDQGKPGQELASTLEKRLDEEMAKTVEYQQKITELESLVTDLKSSSGRRGGANLKNKLKKLENELTVKQGQIEELKKTLIGKEETIAVLNERLVTWENNGDDSWELGEVQQKCLSLENSLLQLSQQCEHLRKENIEVVHQLSGEKVRRIRAEEEAEAVRSVHAAAEALEARVQALEAAEGVRTEAGSDLDYANIVIASKDTEIFNLQSALADRSQALDRIKEELQKALSVNKTLQSEFSKTTEEVLELRAKVADLDAVSKNWQNELNVLQGVLSEKDKQIEKMNNYIQDQGTSYDTQTNELLNRMRSLADECQHLKQERHKLQVSLESVMAESAITAQQRSQMEDKLLQAEKNLQDQYNSLQQVYNEKEMLTQERQEMIVRFEETEKALQLAVAERNDAVKLYNEIVADRSVVGQEQLDAKARELDAMTSKAKILAANLKKKTQSEKDLHEQIVSLNKERENLLRQLGEGQQMSEKWVSENNEKENLIRLQEHLLEEKQQLESTNSSLLQEGQFLSQQVETLSLEIEKLKQQLQTVETEKTSLLGGMQKLHEDYRSLEESLAKNNENAALVESEYSSLLKRLTDVEEKWTKERSEKESVEAVLSKMNEELNALKQSFELEEQENEALMKKLTVLAEEREQLLNKGQEVQSSLNDLQERHDNLAEESAAMKKLLEAASLTEENYRALEDKIIQLTEEKSSLEQRLESMNEMASYGARLEESNKLVVELEEKLERFREEKEAIASQLLDNEEKSRCEIERSNALVTQLEKQVNNFNLAFDAEVQKNASLKQEIDELRSKIQQKETEIAKLAGRPKVAEEKTERKKKKSVTFMTDDVDYLKELKGEIAELQKILAERNDTIENLQATLNEKERMTSTSVTQNEGPKSFNVNLFEDTPFNDEFSQLANPEPADFFGEESLLWDDSWGAEGQLEQEHAISKVGFPGADPDKVVKLESELKALHAEKETINEELRVLQVKYSKVIKKLKEQKLVIERLQSEVKSAKNIGSGDLDVAIMEELRSEMAKAETKVTEVKKELDVVKQEKDSLLKRIDVLSAGNDRFLELKERQDNDAAMWQSKCSELRTQVTELQAQLEAPPADDSQISQENRELKNLIEALEWKVSELTEMVEEKDEELIRRNEQEASLQDSANQELLQKTTEKLEETERQLNSLAEENETLQTILNEQKLKSKEKIEVNEPPVLSQWFPPEGSQSELFLQAQNLLPTPNNETNDLNAALAEEIKQLKDQLNTKDQEIARITNDLNESNAQLQTEITRLATQLQLKEQELTNLEIRCEELAKAYYSSKVEIERLLNENRLHSESILEEELRRSIESEKARYELIIKERDLELASLRESFGTVERDWDESQDRNTGTVERLKAQLRELDSEASHVAEEKEIEIRELRAECTELRQLCEERESQLSNLRLELSSLNQAYETLKGDNRLEEELLELKSSSDAQILLLREELIIANQLLQEKIEALKQAESNYRQSEFDIAGEMKLLQQRLSAKEAESSAAEAELFSRDAEIRELRADLISKETELREQRATLQNLHAEVSQFRNFDKQLKELKSVQNSDAPQSPDWTAEDLSAQLQTDLDAALYMLHQRDVRCEELTFELTQLLEERDTLQLRLSTAIRQNEEMRLNSTPASPIAAQQEPANEQGHMQHLANKISELHNVGYGRDKSIQDESQQRHREQMALLARETRNKTQVFEV